MKKLLLGTAAVALGLSFAASQASAQISLDVGGHAKLYGSWLNEDTATGSDERSIDILRETELHFNGETTLDNGLTVGVHHEIDLDGTDGGSDGLMTEESYAYFSGAWGRVNFGKEDGAAYLLQVAAPSADSNVDGIRQWIQGTNFNLLPTSVGTDTIGLGDLTSIGNSIAPVVQAAGVVNDIYFNSAGGTYAPNTRFDYDQAVSGYENKLTYMTPVFNGFQAGVSYTPHINGANGSRDYGTGNNQDNVAGDYGDVWDVAARYEGQFDEVGVTFGGGYTHASLAKDNGVVFFRSSTDAIYGNEAEVVVAKYDDRQAWNVGLDLNWKAFGLGGAYMEDDNGVSNDKLLAKTWVVGLDYTTGPFKLGASYYDQTQDIASAELDSQRWTGGVVYTYGPGMTFRGSVSWLNMDENVGDAHSDANSTNVLLGTQINF